MTHNPLRSRPLVVIPDRPAISRKVMVAAWNRESGICYLCGKPVAFTGPGVEWEHRDNRAVSGNDDVSNIYPVHPVCHTPKTAVDAGRTAKTKRQEKLTQPKIHKPGGFTRWRRFNGEIVERQPKGKTQ